MPAAEGSSAGRWGNSLRPIPLAPPNRRLPISETLHKWGSRADGDSPPAEEPEPVEPRRPTMAEMVDERLRAEALDGMAALAAQHVARAMVNGSDTVSLPSLEPAPDVLEERRWRWLSWLP